MMISRRSWLRRSCWLAAAACPAVARGAEPGPGFQVGFAAGSHDAAGHLMGGTEMRVLVAHAGKIFAGNGYWMDPWHAAGAGGAQILVLDRPGGDWAVDMAFSERLPGGRPRHLAVSALCSMEFRTDAKGATLPRPEARLIASTWDVTGTRSAFVRDGASGRWTGTPLAHDIPRPDFLPQIRCFGVHRDAQTGVDQVFAGDSGGIFRGTFDPSVPGDVRWDRGPELAVADLRLPAAPGLQGRLRISSFAEANGVLYAAIGQQIYRRQDGGNPAWHLLYTNPRQHYSQTGLRGLTAVAGAGNRPMLLAAVEGNGSRIVRIDPADGGETTDLDLDKLLDDAWGTRVSYVIAAYNDMAPVRSGNGPVLLIGMEAFIPPAAPRPPGHVVLDVVHGLEAGGWYLIRSADGRYALRPVDAAVPGIGRSLVGVRAILASPFAAEAGAVYFAGYDANGVAAHDTAWIVRADAATAVPGLL